MRTNQQRRVTNNGRMGVVGRLSRDCIVAVFRYSKAYFRKPATIGVS